MLRFCTRAQRTDVAVFFKVHFIKVDFVKSDTLFKSMLDEFDKCRVMEPPRRWSYLMALRYSLMFVCQQPPKALIKLLWKWKVTLLSHVQLFATPWTVDYQAPLSMGFSRREYWIGLPFPSPWDLPDPGIEPRSPTL